MDNSYGGRPPWPTLQGQNMPQMFPPGYMTNGQPRMDPRLLQDPSVQQRFPVSNGYQMPGPNMQTATSMGMYPNQMWDMDVPRNMFMQAMNFDRMNPMMMNGQAVSIADLNNSAAQGRKDDSNMDIIEQQQSMEQTRLLHRFKELRQWQQQQQEMLLTQQQQQLSTLRKEQEKVQTMINRQRDSQWGGGNIHNTAAKDMATPPRRQHLTDIDVSQFKNHHQPSRGALPRPVIYVPPQDDDDNDEIKTNPDLFSDTNSNRGSHATVEEGLFPIPDSASEASVDVLGHHHHHEHVQQRFNKHELDAPKKMHRSFAELEADEDFVNQSYTSPSFPNLQNMRHNLNRSADIEEHSEEGEDDVSDSSSDEEEEEEEQDTQIEVKDPTSLDEVPIKPGVDGTKTFEQLLEEQLQAEEERLRQAQLDTDSPSHPKKSFLKKGQGIARFEKPAQGQGPSKKSATKDGGHAGQSSNRSTAQSTKATSSGVQANSKSGRVNSKPPTQQSNKGTKMASKTAQGTSGKGGTGKMDKKSIQDKTKMSKKKMEGEKGPSEKKSRSDSIPDDASFIANINQRQKESEQDMLELDEFEILEQFADNMSFCSNSSIVTKGLRGLQSDRILTGVLPKNQDAVGSISPRAALIRKLNAEKEAKENLRPKFRHTTEQSSQRTEATAKASSDNTNNGSIKAKVESAWKGDEHETVQNAGANRVIFNSKGGVNKTEGGVDDDDDDEYESVTDDSSDESSDSSEDEGEKRETQSVGTGASPRGLFNRENSHNINVAKSFDELLQEHKNRGRSKNDSVLSTDKKLERVLSYTGMTETSASQTSRSDPESSSDSSDEDEEDKEEEDYGRKSPHRIITRKVAGRPLLGGTATNSSNSNLNSSSFVPFSKSPMVISKEKVSVEDVTIANHDVKFSYHSDSDSMGKCVTSDEDESDIDRKVEKKRNERMVLKFDDDDEWDQLTPQGHKGAQHRRESDVDDEHNKTLVESPESSKQTSAPKKAESPPTSKLMSKLFPKLKPVQKKQEEQVLEKIQTVSQTSVGEGVQSKVLHDKLMELEREIEKFRNENTRLTALRVEREEGLATLKKEIGEFEKEKAAELRRLEEFKAEEMKKLKHERKMFDKYQKAARAGPDKKEREEIENLREQLTDLQDELKRKESRWTATNGRLRDKMDQVDQENDELREEIKLLEKKRIEWMQKDQNKAKPRPVASQPQIRSSTPTHEDQFDVDYLLHNGNAEREQEFLNDLSATSSIRPPGTTKMSQSSRNSHHPPGKPPLANQQSKKINNLNQPPKSSLSQNATKGNLSKKPGTNPSISHGSQHNRPGHSGHSEQSAQQKAGPKTNAVKGKGTTVKTGTSHSDTMRSSLAEDVPRRELGTSAQPQDISMYSEADVSLMKAPSNLPRKLASRVVNQSVIDKGDNDYDEVQHSDGKIERTYKNGAREILFSNGTQKEISADGKSICVSFFNGDMKQILPDQRVVYYYADAQTTHTNYPDGLEILQFPNGQTEKLYPDSTKEISFPDQTIKYIFPNGSEESIFPDGTVIRLEKNGDKTMEFPNGQREIHTLEYKKREYPDGTVKTVYPDGRQETRYSNGRLRVKDKDGNVIVDRLC